MIVLFKSHPPLLNFPPITIFGSPLKNILTDPELYFLLFMNGAMAYLYKADALDPISVVWIFYIQNVLIGIHYFIRILSLRDFSTENFTINKRSVDATPKTKRFTAFFFALHFGLFHLVYFLFLVIATAKTGIGDFDFLYLITAILGFTVNTVFSIISQVRQDREEKPNIGTVMFTPYIRIFPMHIFLILGLGKEINWELADFIPLDSFTVFLLLKGVSDVLFYIITNKTWKVQRPRVMGNTL